MVIPPKTKEFLEKWFYPATERSASDNILLATIYMQVARFSNWCRVTVGEEKTLPSLYIWHFAESGSYKDRPKLKMTSLLAPVLQKQRELKNDIYDKWQKEVDSLTENMSKSEKREFLKNHKPTRFHNVMDEGTEQGFQADRLACQKAGIRHLHYEHEELAGYIVSKDSTFTNIITMLIKGWDAGNTKSKVIQSEYRDHVDGVPITAFAHTSMSRLMEENMRGFNNLKALFASGLARKSFVLFSSKHKRRQRTDDEVDSDKALEIFGETIANQMFDDVFDAVKPKYNEEKKEWETKHISDKLIKKQLNQWRNICFSEAERTKESLIIPEISDRWLKAYRLSAFIALFEHPSELVIKPEDFEFAMELTNKWGEQYKDMVSQHGNDSLSDILNKMRDGRWFSLTEIRLELKLRGNTTLLNNAIEQLQEMANETGERIIIKKGRGLARSFGIEKMPEHKETQPDESISFSASSSSSEAVTRFEKNIIPWEDFWKIPVNNINCWSPVWFDNNIRAGKNVKEGPEMIVFDIDNECETKLQFTMAMAEKSIAGFSGLIVTTKSHLKTKKEWPANERFRIILPVTTPLPVEIEEYKKVYKATAEYFGLLDIKGWTDMKSSSDIARLYYSNKGGRHKYVNGKKADWRIFIEEKHDTHCVNDKWPGKEFPAGQSITLSHGQVVDKNESIIISKQKGHKTTPCYAFCHDDSKPSAFFCISEKDENKWIYFCSSCGKKYF